MVIAALDATVHEASLFAAACFLLGGVDDLAIDLLFLRRYFWRRFRGHSATLPEAPPPLRFAIFIGAWHEQAVIGAMLRQALARLRHDAYRIYVGTYPNDPDTIAAVAAVAEQDPRVRLVIGAEPGPTTKAGNLNTLWHALRQDPAGPPDALVVHDAEDLVHAEELRLFERALVAHDLVQLPVLPLAMQQSRWIAGHYLDEFAASHIKDLIVREEVGAALPTAGTGFAMRWTMLERIAAARAGSPFDAASFTEDYELGLHAGSLGGRATLVRERDPLDGSLIAVRAHFPHEFGASVRQKARWMLGIALAGWDRVGWGRWHAFGDHWMRMRDRRAILAVLVMATGYFALLGFAVEVVAHWVTGTAMPVLSDRLSILFGVNMWLLGWRIAMRFACTNQAYGRGEALRSIPRMLVGNAIALVAAQRAVFSYWKHLWGATLQWDKTDHVFPDDPS